MIEAALLLRRAAQRIPAADARLLLAGVLDLPVSRLPELLPWNWNQPEGRSAEAA